MNVFKYFVVTILFFTSYSYTDAQIEISVEHVEGKKGEKVCVNFNVKGFQNIGIADLKFAYDPKVLGNPSVDNTPCSGGSGYVDTQASSNFSKDKGKGVFLYFDQGGWTLPDGCYFYRLCFDLIGKAGDESPITILPNTEFADTDSEVYTYKVIQKGYVRIAADQLECRKGLCHTSSAENDGSFRFWALGGVPPYSYSINGVAGTNTLSNFEEVTRENLSPGEYTFEITDIEGATCTETISIKNRGNNYPFEASIAIKDSVSCFFRTDATITTDPIKKGYGPYKYEWSNGIFTENNINERTSIGNIGIGSYNVTVTDRASGCKVVSNTIDLSVDTLKLNVTPTAPSCKGGTNGKVTLTAQGGRVEDPSKYSFKLKALDPNSPAPPFFTRYGDTHTYTDIPNGSYKATLFDNAKNKCFVSEEFVFDSQDDGFEIDIAFDSNLCLGLGSKVTFTPTIPSGTDRYEADSLVNQTGTHFDDFIAGSGDQILTVQTLPAGTYTYYTHLSLSGCAADTTFTISEGSAYSVSIDVQQPSCVDANGSIAIITNGGTGPFTYSWNDGNTDASRSELSPGTYSFTVTDTNGCPFDSSVVLNGPSTIPVSIDVTSQITCNNGDDGMLKATVNSTGSFTVAWLSGQDTIGRDRTLNNLASGLYTIIVKDENGCKDSTSIELQNPNSSFDIFIEEIAPQCPTSDDGGLAVIVNSGSSNEPFKYEWRENTTKNILSTDIALSNIQTGTYDLRITDVKGCTLDTILNLSSANTNINIFEIGSKFPPSCFNKCDGQATFQARTNGAYGTYHYIIDGEDTNATNISGPFTLDNLCSGEHEISAVDVNSTCQSSPFKFTIQAKDTVRIDQNRSTVTTPSCYGDNDGSINIVVSGIPAGAEKITWLDKGTEGNLLSGIGAGLYRTEITYGNLITCSVVDSIEVSQPDSLVLSLDDVNTNDINCKDPKSGKIQLLVSGGSPKYTYTWTPNITTDSIAIGLIAANYSVTVTDANGCQKQLEKTLTATEPVVADVLDPIEPVCYGEETCIKVENVRGGTGNKYTFSINNGTANNISDCVSVFAGDHNVTVFDSIGCSYDTTLTIKQPEQLIINAGEDQKIALGESSDIISVEVIYPFPINSFVWTPTEYLEYQTDDNQIIIASPIETTTYTVMAKDTAGCIATDDVIIEVSRRRNVYAANIFSPNGNDDNKTFKLQTGAGVQQINSFKIYDRYGNCIYTETPEGTSMKGWDGTNNKSFALPGVYVYIAEVEFIDGKKITYSGDITLIR